MSTSSESRKLKERDLQQIAGGGAPVVDDIDLPLNEFQALQDVSRDVLQKFQGPGWTLERFTAEILPHLNGNMDAVAALFKITGHADWLQPVKGLRG